MQKAFENRKDRPLLISKVAGAALTALQKRID
jgi:hypothetical protein